MEKIDRYTVLVYAIVAEMGRKELGEMANTEHVKAVLTGPQAANAVDGPLDLSSHQFEEGTDLSGINLAGANLRRTGFVRCILDRASFNNANLEWADLRWCDVRHTDFTEANLARADLHKVDASGATFRGAILDSTNFDDACLERADFTGAKTAKTLWRDADTSKAIGLSPGNDASFDDDGE